MVTRNESRSRWEAHEGDQEVGFADYAERDGVVVFPHTVVPPEFGGRGIAGKIARTSLDDARERGLKVVPECSFYADWIDRHPEYIELLSSSSS